MEILKRGSVFPKTADVTCRNCKSILRINEDDGAKHFDQRDGDFLTVKCPVCQAIITTSLSLFK